MERIVAASSIKAYKAAVFQTIQARLQIKTRRRLKHVDKMFLGESMWKCGDLYKNILLFLAQAIKANLKTLINAVLVC